MVEKKICPARLTRVRACIEPGHGELSLRRQCELLGLARGSWYYEPAGETAVNLKLMRRIDKLYLKRPYFGSRRIADEFDVNRKRVQRLMRIMGLEAIYPKPRTTVRCPEHKIYPYLLRNVEIERPNHVWSTDITYIPLQGGYVYLTAIIDWYQPVCVVVAVVEQLGRSVLHRGVGGSLAGKRAGDFQHGSRSAVYELGVHELSGVARRGDQHGRSRPGVGQRVRGAVMANGEVRGGVLEGLRERLAGGDEPS